jgi:hypothetical protein
MYCRGEFNTGPPICQSSVIPIELLNIYYAILLACRQLRMRKLKCPQYIRLNAFITILRGPQGPQIVLRIPGFNRLFRIEFVKKILSFLTI